MRALCRRAGLVLLFWPLLLSAVTAAGAASAAEGAPPRSEQLLPGLYRINGEGGGALVRRWDDGSLLLVDGGREAQAAAWMAALADIAQAERPQLRALMLTASGSANTGPVPALAAAGVPVVAPQAVATRLAAAGLRHNGDTGRLITFGTDYLLRDGNVEAEIEHVGRGRTGADSVVLFRDLRAVAVGGLYTDGEPMPDCAAGGSLAGWVAALEHVLWFDFDWAVPSRGAPVRKPELAAWKDRLKDRVARGDSEACGG